MPTLRARCGSGNPTDTGVATLTSSVHVADTQCPRSWGTVESAPEVVCSADPLAAARRLAPLPC